MNEAAHPTSYAGALGWLGAAFAIELIVWRIAIGTQVDNLFTLPSVTTLVLLGVGLASIVEGQRLRGAGLLAGCALGLMLGISI